MILDRFILQTKVTKKKKTTKHYNNLMK